MTAEGMVGAPTCYLPKMLKSCKLHVACCRVVCTFIQLTYICPHLDGIGRVDRNMFCPQLFLTLFFGLAAALKNGMDGILPSKENGLVSKHINLLLFVHYLEYIVSPEPTEYLCKLCLLWMGMP
jgi:hypothetical protein